MKYEFIDHELGKVVVATSARSRNFVFSVRPDGIRVSAPLEVSMSKIQLELEKMRPKLKEAYDKHSHPLIDLNYTIDTHFFKMKVVTANVDTFTVRSELGNMKIMCPRNATFNNDKLQEWFREMIVDALRRNAKIVLTQRLYMFSETHKLPYKSVKINASKGRWGSCSTKGNINLSCYLMLLPLHLIDYVLLHELTHTVEMSHSDKFWEYLDKLTERKSKILRQELKDYSTTF